MDPQSALDLLDWKRRIFELYRVIRTTSDPAAAWRSWCESRDDMFRTHPQSPVPADERAAFPGVPYFPYDPAFRTTADIERVEPQSFEIPTSGNETMRFTRFARCHFELEGTAHALSAYWLDAYGGGLFLSFRDATSGTTTYGAGRYLLDTVKGSDLGSVEGALVLDFNFAYNPSCSYDPRWVCPLAPPENRLDVPIEAGERVPPTN
ncbi:MAG TPA: DUF1684 domain-containing protein [Actinomycetota bacterium]|nr:DUF1684 domain-containing protein [Actinomycetota bacterium]